jgi:Kdo2-lipid IVA lauroyltransferase/acyltransferase
MHAPASTTPATTPAPLANPQDPPKHRPPRIRKKKPAWIAEPQGWAVRGAMTVPMAMGLTSALRAAKAVGRAIPHIPSIGPKYMGRAVKNISDAFPDWPQEKVQQYAVYSLEHLCQFGVEVMYSPRLITQEGFTRHLVFNDIDPAVREMLSERPVILITGHVGNWELIGYAISMLGFPMHAVYRPLDLAPLDAWMLDTRQRRGLTLVSKFGAVKALPPVMKAGFPVGLVADQSGGDRGLFTPFFGRLTSTYKSIGILAMQTGATLLCGMARRMRQGEPLPHGPWIETPSGGRQFRSTADSPSLRYSVEMVDKFGPEDWNKQPDPLYYLTARYRRAIEMMVRAAPEQYFWMHRIWRSRPAHERLGKPFPQMLKDKLASLPWMTSADVEAVIERSRQDAMAVRPLLA